MDTMIDQQMFALDMEALTNRLKRLEIQDKVVTLLNDLWDQICITTKERRTIEITSDENGMEITLGELMVPMFYFKNEKKFWRTLQQVLKSQVRWEHWLKSIIQQRFVSDWINEPFAPWYWKINTTLLLKR